MKLWVEKFVVVGARVELVAAAAVVAAAEGVSVVVVADVDEACAAFEATDIRSEVGALVLAESFDGAAAAVAAAPATAPGDGGG